MKKLKLIRNYQFILMGFMALYLIASLFDYTPSLYTTVNVILLLLFTASNILYSILKDIYEKIEKLEENKNKKL